MPAQALTAAGTPSERQTVLHSWCIQTEWNAPTIVGGAGARRYSNLGHQHPRVIAAIRAQAEELGS